MRLFLFANMRNERHNLDWFLAHYRKIGVTDFVIVDNGSTDGTAEHLSTCPDVQVVDMPQSSFKAAKHGVDWLNALRQERARGSWCLFVDADEMLVYPGFPEIPLTVLLERMGMLGQRCLVAPMLDMFNAADLFEAELGDGLSPLDLWPHYMGRALRVTPAETFPYVGFRGGARTEFFGDALEARTGRNSPNLRKIPVLFAESGEEYVTVHSTVELAPATFTCALLHFKVNRYLRIRAGEEASRKEHAEEAVEYQAYVDAFAETPAAPEDYDTWEGVNGLVRQGLMVCPADWQKYINKHGGNVEHVTRPTYGGLTLWPGLANAIRASIDF